MTINLLSCQSQIVYVKFCRSKVFVGTMLVELREVRLVGVMRLQVSLFSIFSSIYFFSSALCVHSDPFYDLNLAHHASKAQTKPKNP